MSAKSAASGAVFGVLSMAVLCQRLNGKKIRLDEHLQGAATLAGRDPA
jgi:hypothetical protein